MHIVYMYVYIYIYRAPAAWVRHFALTLTTHCDDTLAMSPAPLTTHCDDTFPDDALPPDDTLPPDDAL